MSADNLDKQNLRRVKKIFITLFLIFAAIGILVYSISNTIEKQRKLPSLHTTKKDLSVRGDILSSDNFKISTSKKIYTASIDTRSLDKNKQELFIELFSIYSSIEKKYLRLKIKKSYRRPGFLILSRNISARDAKNLKLLAYKLQKLKVFKAIKLNGSRIVFGLSLFETGETRIYPYEDTLTPVIGYIKEKNNKKGKLKTNGIKGLERSYNSQLNQGVNGVLKGERDILSYIIFNKDSIIQTRKDGQALKLNIPLRLQKNIELMLDTYKTKLGADEIIISIMDSTNGKVLSLATSNRFNPKKIRKEDYGSLNVNAIEQVFEPGSVLKPISISLVLDKNRASMDELFFAYNKGKRNKAGEYKEGMIKVGRWPIRDDHKFKKNYLTVQDIVMYSSNIGTLQLAQRLKGAELLEGYHKFGIAKKTGIDLPYEKVGKLPSVYQLRAGENQGKLNVFKATVSYGQGMTSSFMQILKAYTVFNNDGKIVTPTIVQKELTHHPVQVISKKTANIMKRLLIKTVTDGTGKKAIVKGLEIGGKTGTANIARGGRYKRKYMSSFFGFVNDENKKYTIGVTVNNPISRGKYWYYYYASNSAVPVFKEIVDILVKLNYLEPNTAIIAKN
ncbi:MAG TPA: penicillin-binding protein 2 [Arcobacter sp.]|nr:penicillin-binding protein 2 [Arcobacter sp.]